MKGAIINIEQSSAVRKSPCTPPASVQKAASSSTRRKNARTALFKPVLEVSKELSVDLGQNDVLPVNRRQGNNTPELLAGKTVAKTRQRDGGDLIIYNSSIVSRSSPTSDATPAKSFKFSSTVPVAIPVPPDRQSSPRTFGSTYPSPLKLPSAYIPSSSKSPLQFAAYAGAKFSDPPSPKVLPKPPGHWFGSSCGAEERMGSSPGYISGLLASPVAPFLADNCQEMTSALKSMLKVQC